MCGQIISGINIGKMTQKEDWITTKDMFGFGDVWFWRMFSVFKDLYREHLKQKKYLFLSFPIQIFENIKQSKNKVVVCN